MRRPKAQRHELPAASRIRVKDVLGGLHHEYWLEEIAAYGRMMFLRRTGNRASGKVSSFVFQDSKTARHHF